MQTHCEQFGGEYVETTDNEEFLGIKSHFFKYLFGNDNAYLTYEDFPAFLESLNTDPATEREIKRILSSNIYPEGKSLQMGYKGELDKNEKWHFVHIPTGLEVIRPKGQEEMIEVSWNGFDDSHRFTKWFNLCYSMIISDESLRLMEHLCTKRMKVHFMNEVDTGIMELIDSVYNGHPFFYDKSGNFAILASNEVVPAKDFREFQAAVYTGGDRKMADLGRVGNTNPKMERMTTGENYKDLMPLANRQRLTLDMLKLFSMKAKKKGQLELSFAVNGIPERMPLEGDAEQPRPEESQALTGAMDDPRKAKFSPMKTQ